MHIQIMVCSAILFPAAALFGGTPEDFFARASENMAETSSLQTEFIQTKKLKAFRKPLVITGELCMGRSGRFVWRVKSPIRYTCLITKEKLSQWDADTGKVLTLDIASNPGLQYLTRSLSGYFSGKFGDMQKDFEPTAFSEQENRGEMRPKAGVPAANFIRCIRFTFTDNSLSELKQVRIQEASGDETIIDFHSTVKNQPIPEEKWRLEQK